MRTLATPPNEPLDLPELTITTERDLMWRVGLDTDGDILISLDTVNSHGDRVSRASGTSPTASGAEELALKIWDNYQAVRATR